MKTRKLSRNSPSEESQRNEIRFFTVLFPDITKLSNGLSLDELR